MQPANNTTAQTLWTCPAGFRAIIKRVQLVNLDSNNVDVEFLTLYDGAGVQAYVWMYTYQLLQTQVWPDWQESARSIGPVSVALQYSVPKYVIADPGDHVELKFSGTAAATRCVGHGTLLELP